MEGQSGGPGLQPRPPQTEKQKQFQPLELSDHEKKILEQVKHESFFYGCIPMMATGVALDVLMVWRGLMKPSMRRKIGISMLGYFAGRAMYINEYKQRILTQAPDGELAARIRKMGGGKPFAFEQQQERSLVEQPVERDENRAQLADYTSGINFDSTPLAKGLEDRSYDVRKAELEKDNKKQSYDELRVKNRTSLEPSKPVYPASVSQPDQSSPPAQREERRKPGFIADESKQRVKRNQYGDAVE